MRASTCGGASPTARFSASALIDRRAEEASSGAKSRTARSALEVSCLRAVRSLALARRRSVGSPRAASRRGFQTLRGPSPPFCGATRHFTGIGANILHFFKTARSGEPFALRTCHRSLGASSDKLSNRALLTSPAEYLTGSRARTRGVDRVEGTRARMVLGRVLLAGGGGGDGAHGTPRHPANSLPRPATRVVARAVRHSQESTFLTRLTLFSSPLARRSPAVHVRGTRVLLRRTPPLLDRRQAHGEDRPPIGASPSPLDTPRSSSRRRNDRLSPVASIRRPLTPAPPLPSILVAHRRDPRRHRGGSPRLADRAQTGRSHHARGVRIGAHGARGRRGG